MGKLAAYDSTGAITAYYDSVDSPAPAGLATIGLTDQQWQACITQPGWTVANGALVAPPPGTVVGPYVPSAQEAYAAALAAGCAIVSTSTPALNGTYAIGTENITYMNSEINSILLNGTFTNGGTTWGWEDVTGTIHVFTIPQFKAFASAVAAYVSALFSASKSSPWVAPAQPVTIP